MLQGRWSPARPSRIQRQVEECPRNTRKTRKQRIPTPFEHETVIARSVAPKQSSWIATARFAHLAMTRIKKIRAVGIIPRVPCVPWAQWLGADPRSQTSCSEIVLRINTDVQSSRAGARGSSEFSEHVVLLGGPAPSHWAHGTHGTRGIIPTARIF